MRIAVLAVLIATAGARSPGPIQRPYEQFAPIADSLAKAVSVAYAHTWVDSVFGGSKDAGTQAAIQLWHGKRYAAHEYELDTGAPYLARALKAAQAQRDTFAIAYVHDRRGLGALIIGRQEEAKKDFAEAVRYAKRAGFTEIEGDAHRGLGGIAKVEGAYARAQRELALAVKQLAQPSFEWLHSQLMLGEMMNRTGHPDDARDKFEEVLAEAKRRNHRWTIAAATQDLANVEFEQGDMAEADRRWYAAALQFDTLATRKMAPPTAAIGSRTNRAHALAVLGRYAEAEKLLDQQVAASSKLEDPGERISCIGELGTV